MSSKHILSHPSLISLPSCPTAHEENWRRTSPELFFLPSDEVTGICGKLLQENYFFEWNITNKKITETELISKILDFLSVNKSESEINLLKNITNNSIKPNNIALIITQNGNAQIYTSQNSTAKITAISVQNEQTHSILPNSPIGDALNTRLRSSCPQQLEITIGTHVPDSEPLVFYFQNPQPTNSQSYADVSFTLSNHTIAQLAVIENATAPFVFHRHSIKLGRHSKLSGLWQCGSLDEQDENRVLLERIVTLNEGAKFLDGQIFLSAGNMRILSHTELQESEAIAQSGAALIGVRSNTIDYEPIQNHVAHKGVSSLISKALVTGRARCIFQGLIKVQRQAQSCQAQQLNKNLLLSKRGRVDSIPRLEISPEDVACKHGSATAELDEAQIYYLTTRGFKEQQAKKMVTEGFLKESLQPLETAPILFELGSATLEHALNTL